MSDPARKPGPFDFVNQYHQDTVGQKKARRNADGSITTVLSNGLEMDGMLYAVPGYNRDTGEDYTRDQQIESFGEAIKSGQIPGIPVEWDGAMEDHPHNVAARENHKLIEGPSDGSEVGYDRSQPDLFADMNNPFEGMSNPFEGGGEFQGMNNPFADMSNPFVDQPDEGPEIGYDLYDDGILAKGADVARSVTDSLTPSDDLVNTFVGGDEALYSQALKGGALLAEKFGMNERSADMLSLAKAYDSSSAEKAYIPEHGDVGLEQFKNMNNPEWWKKTMAATIPGSVPFLAGAASGGATGFVLGGPVGALIGATLGGGGTAFAQEIGTAYYDYLEQAPNDTDGAIDFALNKAGLTGIINAASVPLALVGGPASQPLKYALIQALGIQPGVGVVDTVSGNLMQSHIDPNQPLEQGVAAAYAGEALFEGPATAALTSDIAGEKAGEAIRKRRDPNYDPNREIDMGDIFPGGFDGPNDGGSGGAAEAEPTTPNANMSVTTLADGTEIDASTGEVVSREEFAESETNRAVSESLQQGDQVDLTEPDQPTGPPAAETPPLDAYADDFGPAIQDVAPQVLNANQQPPPEEPEQPEQSRYDEVIAILRADEDSRIDAMTPEDREAHYLSESENNEAGMRDFELHEEAQDIIAEEDRTGKKWTGAQLPEQGNAPAEATEIDVAAHESATSPQNDTPEPTDAQIEAGNYKKGHISWGGFDISIENPRGSTRSGTDPDGNEWSHEMGSHYGYIKKTEGADGDHVDVFIGNGSEAGLVYVIDQVNEDGTFDEHKVMLGFGTQGDAVRAYMENYDDGWTVGPVTMVSRKNFDSWLKGDTTQPMDPALRVAERDRADAARREESKQKELAGDYADYEAPVLPAKNVGDAATGKAVADMYRSLPSTEGMMDEHLAGEIEKRDFTLQEVPIQDLVERDVTLADALGNMNKGKFDSPVDAFPIIVGTDANGQEGVVLDGMHRIEQLIESGSERVRAYVENVKSAGQDAVDTYWESKAFVDLTTKSGKKYGLSHYADNYHIVQDGKTVLESDSEVAIVEKLNELGVVSAIPNRHALEAGEKVAARNKREQEKKPGIHEISKEEESGTDEDAELNKALAEIEGGSKPKTLDEAENEGFNTSTPYYHLTPDDFEHFIPGGPRKLDGQAGIFFTSDSTNQPAAHTGGPGAPGARVIPVYLKMGSTWTYSNETRELDLQDWDFSEFFPYIITESDKAQLVARGYDSLRLIPGERWNMPEETVVWDDSQILSVFTPANSEKSVRESDRVGAVPNGLSVVRSEELAEGGYAVDVTDGQDEYRGIGGTESEATADAVAAYKEENQEGIQGDGENEDQPAGVRSDESDTESDDAEGDQDEGSTVEAEGAGDEGEAETVRNGERTLDALTAAAKDLSERVTKEAESRDVIHAGLEVLDRELSRVLDDAVYWLNKGDDYWEVDGHDSESGAMRSYEGGLEEAWEAFDEFNDQLAYIIDRDGNRGNDFVQRSAGPRNDENRFTPYSGKDLEPHDIGFESDVEISPSLDAAPFQKSTYWLHQLFADNRTPKNIYNNKDTKPPVVTQEEADAIRAGWKVHVTGQRNETAADGKQNSQRTIISLFDTTGSWSKPYEEAGYQVVRLDVQDGVDIEDVDMQWLFDWAGDNIEDVYGVLAACPCTIFTVANNRNWPAGDADGRLESSKSLVFRTLELIEFVRPKFWVVENPRSSRIGEPEKGDPTYSTTGLPVPRITFSRFNFGDHGVKPTSLWGNFNSDLPTANLGGTDKSFTNEVGGNSKETKRARSKTPEGFAYAFFMANNAIDDGAKQVLKYQYPAATGAVEAAIDAGLSPEEITSVGGDFYEWDDGVNMAGKLYRLAVERKSVGASRSDLVDDIEKYRQIMSDVAAGKRPAANPDAWATSITEMLEALEGTDTLDDVIAKTGEPKVHDPDKDDTEAFAKTHYGDSGFVPRAMWRDNLIAAREYADHLGIEWRGNSIKLPDLVADIELVVSEKEAEAANMAEMQAEAELAEQEAEEQQQEFDAGYGLTDEEDQQALDALKNDDDETLEQLTAKISEAYGTNKIPAMIAGKINNIISKDHVDPKEIAEMVARENGDDTSIFMGLLKLQNKARKRNEHDATSEQERVTTTSAEGEIGEAGYTIEEEAAERSQRAKAGSFRSKLKKQRGSEAGEYGDWGKKEWGRNDIAGQGFGETHAVSKFRGSWRASRLEQIPSNVSVGWGKATNPKNGTVGFFVSVDFGHEISYGSGKVMPVEPTSSMLSNIAGWIDGTVANVPPYLNQNGASESGGGFRTQRGRKIIRIDRYDENVVEDINWRIELAKMPLEKRLVMAGAPHPDVTGEEVGRAKYAPIGTAKAWAAELVEKLDAISDGGDPKFANRLDVYSETVPDTIAAREQVMAIVDAHGEIVAALPEGETLSEKPQEPEQQTAEQQAENRKAQMEVAAERRAEKAAQDLEAGKTLSGFQHPTLSEKQVNYAADIRVNEYLNSIGAPPGAYLHKETRAYRDAYTAALTGNYTESEQAKFQGADADVRTGFSTGLIDAETRTFPIRGNGDFVLDSEEDAKRQLKEAYPVEVQQSSQSGMTLEFDGNRYPVDSMEDASRKFTEARNRLENEGAAGARAMGSEFPVYDGDTRIGFISYNGRMWESEGVPYKPAVEAQAEEKPPVASLEPVTAQGVKFPRLTKAQVNYAVDAYMDMHYQARLKDSPDLERESFELGHEDLAQGYRHGLTGDWDGLVKAVQERFGEDTYPNHTVADLGYRHAVEAVKEKRYAVLPKPATMDEAAALAEPKANTAKDEPAEELIEANKGDWDGDNINTPDASGAVKVWKEDDGWHSEGAHSVVDAPGGSQKIEGTDDWRRIGKGKATRDEAIRLALLKVEATATIWAYGQEYATKTARDQAKATLEWITKQLVELAEKEAAENDTIEDSTGGNTDAELDRAGAGTLEGVSAGAVRGAEGPGSEVSQAGAVPSGEENRGRDRQSDGSGDEPSGGMGNDAGEVSVSGAGESRERSPGSGGLEGHSPSLDHTIDANEIGKSGDKTKYRNNVAAIQLLKQLESDGRLANPEEQSVLAKYVGWGGLPQAFKARKGWSDEVKELKALLTEEEYAAARRSTQDAHYTSTEIIDGIYAALDRMGFQSGVILEPSLGSGNFFGMMPKAMREESELIGVELDHLTGGIAKQLYQNADIHAPIGFQDFSMADGHYDLAIGNPPFGSQQIYDGTRRDISKFSIHNYFFAKSLAGLRPGGLLAMVVSNSFLDKLGSKQRKHMAAQAEFIGAIRLPNDAFKANAGTEVTTDIIFMRKLDVLDVAPDTEWTGTTPITGADGTEMVINKYFAANPQMMLGEMRSEGSMYRKGSAALIAADGQDTPALLQEAIATLPEGIFTPIFREKAPVVETLPEIEAGSAIENAPINGLFIREDGQLMKRIPDSNGNPQAIERNTRDNSKNEEVALKDREIERIKGMVEISQTLSTLLKAQLTDAADTQLDELRSTLGEQYDAFVKKNGLINARTNKGLFRDDPMWPRTAALEVNYDAGVSATVAKKTGISSRKPSAKKADVFTTRTQKPYTPVTRVATASEGLGVSLSEKGQLDLNHIAQLTDKSVEQVIDDLGDLVFRDPVHGWETSEQYLSGNVKRKLRQAESAAAEDDAFARNVTALEAVIPADIDAADIKVKLGAPWVPPQILGEFVDFLAGEKLDVVFSYAAPIAKWSVSQRRTFNNKLRMEWGVPDRDALEIIMGIANNKPLAIRRKNSDGSSFLDKEATDAANEKGNEIKEAWEEWLWQDADRRVSLQRLYNDTQNTTISRKFDGSHLTLPGAIDESIISLRPHQKNFIWRAMQSPTTLADHVVGAGKTFAMIGAAMEMRRTGLAKKPMLVVPNHLVQQWANDFQLLYPNANILVPSKADFALRKRKELFGRIATGDWDAVIVAHSSFKKLPSDPETERSFIDQQIRDLEESVRLMKENSGGDNRSIKDMEKAKERLENRMKEMADAGSDHKDDGLTFQELGADAVFVDEAHEFKNLSYMTSMGRVAGLGNTAGSQKASDMFVKTQSVIGRNGRVIFATGTPISNSIAEVYTVQRYLGYGALKERGLAHFDAWAAVYGEIVTQPELDATGVKYKMNSRFNKFVNIPEVLQQYFQFADVINRDDIQAMLAEQGKTLPIPQVKGGKPTNHIVPRNHMVESYMGEIVKRAENMKNVDPSEDNMLKVTSDARKAALDFRLIDPSAPDDPNTKTNAALEQILRLYKKWDAESGTQLVFLDLSTPKGAVAKERARILELTRKAEQGDDAASAELDKISPDEIMALQSSFSVYDDLRAKLIDAGIPESEVVFIHEANTDERKQALFDKVNRGEIRILMGSTQKMGAGMNVQERLVAAHHLDAPWKPSDLEQRNGRIIRQGNKLYIRDPDGFEIEIINYATEQTYDSRMWQTIEGKATFIEAFRKGDLLQREIDDITGDAANAAEMKAAASGNPLIMREFQLRSELARLEGLEKQHNRKAWRHQDELKWERRRAESLPEEIRMMEQDKATIDGNQFPLDDKGEPVFTMKVSGKTVTEREEAGESLLKLLRHFMSTNADVLDNVGEYHGMSIGFSRINEKSASLDLTGLLTQNSVISDVDGGSSAAGLLQRLGNLSKGVSSSLYSAEGDLKRANKNIADLEGIEVGEFKFKSDLAEVKNEHAEVVKELSKTDEDRQKERENIDAELKAAIQPEAAMAQAGYMFNRSATLPLTAKPRGLAKVHAERIVAKFLKQFPGAASVQVRVVKEQSEFFAGAGYLIKAGYQFGADRITIVAANLESAADLKATLRHELFAHKGLGIFSQDDVSAILNAARSTAEASDGPLRLIWEEVQADYADHSDSLKAEELIARIAEETDFNPLKKAWHKFVQVLRKILIKYGLLPAKATMADFKDIIYHIGAALKDGKKPNARPDRMPGAASLQGAYQGSPHRFDKYSTDHIGSGEGTQHEGWGLYFAGRKDIAQWYRDMLSSSDRVVTFNGKAIIEEKQQPDKGFFKTNKRRIQEWVLAELHNLGNAHVTTPSMQEMIDELKARIEKFSDYPIVDPIKTKATINLSDAIAWLEKNQHRIKVAALDGALYAVDIPEDHELIEWDKDLADQAPDIKRKLLAAFPELQEIFDEGGYVDLRDVIDNYDELTPKEVSLRLLDAGIPGHRYYDRASRKNEAERTYNYVIYDDSRISITDTMYSKNRGLRNTKTVDDLSDSLGATPGVRSLHLYENSHGDIKLETIIVDKDSRKQGVGSAVIEQITQYADQHGKRVILDPAVKDDYQGTTSRSRLVKFYKRHGFVENKGRNKDFSISAGMFREPNDTPVFSRNRDRSGELDGLTEQEVKQWRKDHKESNRKGRVPAVQEAAKWLSDGFISSSEYRDIVRTNMPIEPLTEVPELASIRDIARAVSADKVAKHGILNAGKTIEDGTRVATRLDIPAYDFYGTWVVTVHEGRTRSGNAMGYGQSAYLTDVEFKTSPKGALKIATGSSPKAPFARMHGDWVDYEPDDMRDLAELALNDPAWVQVGMNPFRHSFFYDKSDGTPVITADQVVQIGPLVMAKGVEYGDPESEQFKVADDVYFNRKAKEEGEKPEYKSKAQRAQEWNEKVDRQDEIRREIDAAELSTILEMNQRDRKEKLSDWLKDRTADGYKGFLAVIPRQYLSDFAPDNVTSIAKYIHDANAMEGRRNHLIGEHVELVEHWEGFAKQNAKDNRKMADLMYQTTLAGVDPSVPYLPLTTEELTAERIAIEQEKARTAPGESKMQFFKNIQKAKNLLAQEKKRAEIYPILLAKWDALPTDAQGIYKDARDAYKKQRDRVFLALEERIERTEASERSKANLMDVLRSELETQAVQDPYFPLQRFGDFWTAVFDPETDELVDYQMFEKESMQVRFVGKMEQKGLSVASGRHSRPDENDGAVNAGFATAIADMMGELQPDVAQALQDEVWQTYLKLLPELSARKSFIHRKKMPGYNEDALRTYAHNMFHGAHQLAKLEWRDRLESLLADSQSQAREVKDLRERNKATVLVHEMYDRHQWAMNPTASSLATNLTASGFAWYLGANISSAAVNLTQTVQIAYPVLGAKFGYDEAAKELIAASATFIKGTDNLKGSEKLAFENFLDSGVLDKTQAHDLAGVAEYGENYLSTTHKAMSAVSYLFHHAEKINREVTALAAYRLARKDGMGHDAAIDYAKDAVWMSHYNYANSNRPRVMQNDLAKVAFLFKQYSLNTTYRMARDLHDMLKDADPEVRREAKRRFVGIQIMSGVLAGLQGIWMAKVVAWVISQVFDDEDEPFELIPETRAFLAEWLGSTAADAIMVGMFEAFTPFGISNRVSLSDLWFRDENRDIEGHSKLQNYFMSLMGPLPSAAIDFTKGVGLIADGKVQRGLEKMMPTFMENVSKGVRYASEGVTTMRDDPVVDAEEVGMFDAVSQIAGFSPSKVNKQYAENSAISYYEDRILNRRSDLLTGYYNADRAGDTGAMEDIEKAIDRFNGRNPEKPITPKQIKASLKARYRFSDGFSSGLLINKDLQYLKEDLSFGE